MRPAVWSSSSSRARSRVRRRCWDRPRRDSSGGRGRSRRPAGSWSGWPRGGRTPERPLGRAYHLESSRGEGAMEVVITTADSVGPTAADAVDQLYRDNPDGVLGLATGSSPLAIYDELSRRVSSGGLSLARARAFILDEYVGLPADHRELPQRHRAGLRRQGRPRPRPGAGSRRHRDGPGRRPAPPTRRPSPMRVASTCRSSASAPTATSPSTSPAPRWRRGPASRRSPRQTRATTPASSATTSTRCPALPDPGHRHDHGGPSPGARRHRARQGRGRPSARRGAGLRHVAGHHAAVHPHVTVVLDDAAADRLQLARYYAETYQAKPSWQGL